MLRSFAGGKVKGPECAGMRRRKAHEDSFSQEAALKKMAGLFIAAQFSWLQ
jgi:hypothetical protein